MPTLMRIPCSKCGQLNNVERAVEREFHCTACGTVNTLRNLSPARGGVPTEGRGRGPATHTQRPVWASQVATRRPATPVAARERSSAFGRVRQVLIALVVLATGATLLHPGGTFATFNAATSNAATITSGVLLLGNKVQSGTECFSAGAGSTIGSGNSNACTGLWSATVVPGNSNTAANTYEVAVRNVGNITPTTFQLYATAGNTCDSAPGFLDATSGTTFKGTNQAVSTTQSGATTTGATSTTVASATGLVIGDVIQVDSGVNLEQLTISNIVGNVLTTNATAHNHANGVAVNGGGLCRQTQLVVAKTDSSYLGSAAGTCLYGNAAAGAPMTGAQHCSYDTLHNLRDFNDNYVTTGGANPGAISLGAFAPGTTDYFVVAVLFPSTSDNSYQGLGATLTFNWFAQQ